MDDIYDHLENFNDENTIAELQAENKELKSKLKEYASALTKLQEHILQDFDTLSSEYKKLELNYSSLLKTAKSEIERKTEIIKNLNIEKDEMVLKSLQNRHPYSRSYNKPTHNDKDQNRIPEKNVVKPEFENKILTQVTMDRTDKSQLPCKDSPVSHLDLRNKLLSLSNTVTDVGPRVKNFDAKENISHSKTDDSFKARALIRNRRKSMPAVRAEIEKFSSDDENLANARHIREKLSRESSGDNRHRIHNYSETTNSRTSETPSLEDRHSGYIEPTYKSRQSRCDRESYRTRSKSAHRNKRFSPERPHTRGPRDYHGGLRPDHDKHRFVENLNYGNYHLRSREAHRDDYDRRYSQERPHRNQDRYPIKHKLPHNSDEIDNKRMKIDPHYRQFEEDQRLRNEREYLENRYVPQPCDGIQFTSCESPDYNYADPHHQVREIKLTATTKLDDPRVSHKKYVVQKNDGEEVLSTTEGRNVNIIPVNKSAWGIKPVKIPDALKHRPPNIDVVKKVNLVAASPPSSLSIESGEICDVIGHKDFYQKSNKEADIPKQVETKIPSINVETKDTESSSQKLSGYKIPKQKKSVKKKNEEIIIGQILHETKKTRTNCDSDKKDAIKKKILNMREIIHHTVPIQSKTELPLLASSESYNRQDNAIKVVEDDLQLSDDTCDNFDEHNHVSKEVLDVTCHGNKAKDTNINLNPEATCEIKTDVSSEIKPIKLTIHLNKEKEDGRKKKKKKHKDAKEEINKGSVDVTEKPTRKKGKETKTKERERETKFCELFGDSSSLITPEDLGLVSVPATTIRQPEQCVPFFEDAQDAEDVKEIQTSKNVAVDNRQNRNIKPIDNKDKLVNVGINLETPEKKNGLKPTIEEPEIIYKNLEPSIPEKQIDVVKTVIISSGVQPQIPIQVTKPEVHAKIEHIRPAHEVALKALATSTPYKLCENVQSEAKISESIQSCDSESRIAVDKTPQIDKSDTSTMDSQTKDNDVPDVRIFMKRRRRVVKK